jgi:hypothetical protein
MTTTTRRRVAAALAAAAAVAALAGCGTAATSHTTTTPPPAAAAPAATANPVTLIRQGGATPTPGERYGTTVADGLSADGTYAGGERITLYTLPAGLTGPQAAAQVGVTSSDSQTVITGPNWYAFIYPAQDPATDAPSYPVTPAAIAAHLHGTVLSPGAP